MYANRERNRVTSETKQYIEAQDILSVRCDCNECHASLSVPMAPNLAESLFKCPKCGKDWVRFSGGTHELTVNAFANAVGDLKRLLPSAGFKFYIEIAPEAEE
jgi:transposase-like protein